MNEAEICLAARNVVGFGTIENKTPVVAGVFRHSVAKGVHTMSSDNSNPDSESRKYIIRDDQPGYIYLMRPVGVNVYKIGCTVNPAIRLATKQRHHSYQLEYVYTCHVHHYGRVEDRLHRELQRAHLCGEWYILSESDIERIKSFAEGWAIE